MLVAAINLDRRPDRWQRLLGNISEVEWRLPQPDRFRACEPDDEPLPAWWRASEGAWGCRLSHVRLLRDALDRGVETLAVFEDDALFEHDFGARLDEFLAAVPDDWELLFLGGQHMKPPRPVAQGVVRATNCQRTHALVYRSDGMRKVLAWWEDLAAWRRRRREHLDHRLGWLQIRGGITAYAPDPFLVGQAANTSDIDGKTHGDRWWSTTRPRRVRSPRPRWDYVAVVGTGRSGSSCLAGVLHHLGVWLGPDLGGYESTGGYEDRELATLCEQAFPFPSPGRQEVPGLATRLADYVAARQAEAATRGTLAAGKYPSLAALGEELRRAVPQRLGVIHCVRPLDESIRSLQTRVQRSESAGDVTDEQCETLQRFLADQVAAFCEAQPAGSVLDVSFADLRRDPRAVIRRLIEFLGIAPTAAQTAAAAAHVRPKLAIHSPPTDVSDGIHPRGYWLDAGETHHRHDPRLAAAIAALFRRRGIAAAYDLGCGPGRYVAALAEAGLDVVGLDGNPHTPAIADGRCGVADLTEPLALGARNAVLCLEVGEHVPQSFEATLLDNVALHADRLVVLSWGVPGQPGHGHVNCRSNAYVAAELGRRGYRLLEDETAALRSAARLPWFRDTLLVFERVGRLAAASIAA